ncbi:MULTISPECIES: phosphatase PAP2 family protein [unclassified Streptomyces]|uniref:phosphatase PAP2 family protein n=1 Tax=unclassified Streptomyces TaxID=2593676 RepID=UPI002DDBD460|nr:phosphatase PAP2 family protein [Streptomyces sp. NBC_01445]WSE03031.1 phosphatase PAP2 family protein [Streptomyces sp. NBC_01445]
MTGRPAPVVLPPSLRMRLGLVAALAALVVVVLGVLYAGSGRPGRVDARIWAAVEGVGPLWRHVAVATDFLGDPVGAAMLVAATVTGCVLLRLPRAAVLVVAGVGITVGTTTLLKQLVGRTIHGDENLSYPSGHTAFATALAFVVALLATGRFGLGRTAGTSLVLAAALVGGAAMGWAQVVLGAHYPTDVVGGWCTALVVIPATAWLVDRTADRLGDRTATAGRRARR